VKRKPKTHVAVMRSFAAFVQGNKMLPRGAILYKRILGMQA